jgi:uncharacterized protein DUF6510
MNATYDGNILAGPLAEVFDMEVTSAIARCAGCGRSTLWPSSPSTDQIQGWWLAARDAVTPCCDSRAHPPLCGSTSAG